MPGLRGIPPKKIAASISSKGFSRSFQVKVEIFEILEKQQSSSYSRSMASSCTLLERSTNLKSISYSAPKMKPLQSDVNREQAILPQAPVKTTFIFLFITKINQVSSGDNIEKNKLSPQKEHNEMFINLNQALKNETNTGFNQKLKMIWESLCKCILQKSLNKYIIIYNNFIKFTIQNNKEPRIKQFNYYLIVKEKLMSKIVKLCTQKHQMITLQTLQVNAKTHIINDQIQKYFSPQQRIKTLQLYCKFLAEQSTIEKCIKFQQLNDFLQIYCMRSLYTQDIQGTKPRLRIVEKSYFKMKHQEQVMRDPKNPDRSHQFQWFTPLPKANKPDYSRQPYLNTIKLISEHTGTSRSMHIESLKKQNSYFQPEKPRNYSVLSHSGLSLINQSRTSINEGNNPYYPHRIRQNYDQSNSTRFTGNRSWNYNPNPQIRLPDPKSEYVSKWVRI